MNTSFWNAQAQEAFDHFGSAYKLSDLQRQQFKTYAHMLAEWNERINLTAIVDATDIIAYHFRDSLEVTKVVDFAQLLKIADVGTGGGFPGLPLKIYYPHLAVILIEVNHKKLQFLQAVIDALNLERVELCDLDWRTFLRSTSNAVDLFCARASLQPEELVRMFQPSSSYKQAQLVYWASVDWSPGKKEAAFVEKELSYSVGQRKRKFVFFRNL